MKSTDRDKPGPLARTSGWRATFSSLENREFRWYWLSLLASFSSMSMSLFIVGLLVYEMTGDVRALGYVNAGFGVPMLIFSLWGGALVDRLDKRNVIIVTQVLAALNMLAIAVLLSLGIIALWHLILASVVNGMVLAFNLPGRQAIIPHLVEREQVMNAVALSSGAMNGTRIFAPALGGVIVSFIGMDGVYYFMVVCYAISAALLFMVSPLGKSPRLRDATVRGDIIAGLRYVRRSPVLLSLLALAFLPIVFGMPYQMLLPVVALDVLNVGQSGLGYLLSMTGVGALLGSLAVASLRDFRHKGLLLLTSCALFGVFIVLFAQSNSYGLSLFLLLWVGAANVAYMTSNNTLLQLHSDDNMRGRVMSLYMMTVGLLPLGTLGLSQAAEYLGTPLAIALGGGVIIVFTVVMTFLRPALRSL